MCKFLTPELLELLLVDETIERYGYDPLSLSFGSTRRILHKCCICEKVKENTFRRFIQEIGLAHREICGLVKMNQTNLQTRGVSYPFQCPDIQQLVKQKHSTEGHPMQDSEVIKKFRQTRIEKGIIWTEQKVRDFLQQEGPNYNLLKWGGKVRSKSKFLCSQGHEYSATFDKFRSGCRCPICNESKGEKLIAQMLSDLGIEFEREYRLGKGNALRLDFYIPTLNLGVEYDGQQHFEPVCFGGISAKKAKQNLEKIQRRDKKKNKLCRDLGIELFRINYAQDQQELLSLKSTLSQ